ncbi:MAG: LysR substrate-binding domain-containing protein [Azospirillaceae bacterium]|nr:LysR substrate-binding domain-containing protein [Azospirillaceae bacterium]
MVARFTLLHSFVVVARAGSMKDAAATLSVTPGAISQRIRQLEKTVGHRLFVRTRVGVRLDPRGAALLAALDAPFGAIEAVERSLHRHPSRRVVVSTVASFAASWLVPRLGGFARRHPDIEIAVETDSRVVDLLKEPVDVAIRHGLGRYPGMDSIKLIAPELIVVASPGLLEAGPPIAKPADCLSFPLLHDLDRGDWSLWFEAHGVATPRRLKGPSFSDDHLLVPAAVAGQGLALIRDVYAQGELASGRLVRALDIGWPTRFAYYAVTRSDREQNAAIRQFRQWLIEEADGGRD